MTHAPCRKCGYDESKFACHYCGNVEHAGTLGNYGGVLKTICCGTDPTKPKKEVKK